MRERHIEKVKERREKDKINREKKVKGFSRTEEEEKKKITKRTRVKERKVSDGDRDERRT